MFTFQGRSNRLTFLGLSLLGALLACAGFGVAAAIDYQLWRGAEENRVILGLITLALMTPGLWIWLAVGVRRCHDIGWSGAWLVLRALPLVGFIQFLWMLFAPGEKHENRFGPPIETASSNAVA